MGSTKTVQVIDVVAKFFSYVFHPLFIPLFGFLVVFSKLPGAEHYPLKLWYVIMGIVMVSAVVLPAAFVGLMAATRNINSDLMHHRDRILPYIFSAFSLYLGAQVMGKLPVPGLFRLFMLAASLLLILLFLVTIFWKISGHAAAIGGLTGLLLAIAFRYGLNAQLEIVLAIVVSGLVGSSRLWLKKHTPLQVYLGYTLGVLVIYLTVYFFGTITAWVNIPSFLLSLVNASLASLIVLCDSIASLYQPSWFVMMMPGLKPCLSSSRNCALANSSTV
jgi:membrane-associated phospholipid phosphatase